MPWIAFDLTPLLRAHRQAGKRLIVPSRSRLGEYTNGQVPVKLIRRASYAEYIANFPFRLPGAREQAFYMDHGYQFFEAEWPKFTN